MRYLFQNKLYQINLNYENVDKIMETTDDKFIIYTLKKINIYENIYFLPNYSDEVFNIDGTIFWPSSGSKYIINDLIKECLGEHFFLTESGTVYCYEYNNQYNDVNCLSHLFINIEFPQKIFKNVNHLVSNEFRSLTFICNTENIKEFII